ncbi:twin-arginine translocase TatA/TatE family subunit [Erythrobacter sp. LQ02-29]|uniref:twin-arginine translocase TatA/TatE family subunit n=1 Tax=Erythrobacter sp. LQ02-29 TaxID=2920384 RepID=UPI001F4DCD6B|nr:twin-arginine translocase TatA/TatE family subunit [Erythrobacter sp. LQ02-29]MCP9222495.1 twin-arginine translocase TatA/TatE family subunit [Erythrobacter sp. LQ02-29]
MSLGPWQLIIIAIVILVLFGRGRISEMMGDFGKGIKSFKEGMNEPDSTSGSSSTPSGRIEGPRHEAKPADTAARDPQPSERSDKQG